MGVGTGGIGRAVGAVGTSTLRGGATAVGGGVEGGVATTLGVGAALVGGGAGVEGVSGSLIPVRREVSWCRAAT
jgi:hypothetical protein